MNYFILFCGWWWSLIPLYFPSKNALTIRNLWITLNPLIPSDARLQWFWIYSSSLVIPTHSFCIIVGGTRLHRIRHHKIIIRHIQENRCVLSSFILLFWISFRVFKYSWYCKNWFLNKFVQVWVLLVSHYIKKFKRIHKIWF